VKVSSASLAEIFLLIYNTVRDSFSPTIEFLNNVGQSGLLNIYIDLVRSAILFSRNKSAPATSHNQTNTAVKVSSNQITESTACETIPGRRHPIRQLERD